MKKLILMILSLFLLMSCDTNSKKIGDCIISYNNGEIVVDGFNYKGGISAIGMIDYNIDFKKLDGFIYAKAIKSNDSQIYITLSIPNDKDSYGNSTGNTEITIGKVDVSDSKLFADFISWEKKYNTLNMFSKDRIEYENSLETNDQNVPFQIVKRYLPKSIR